MASGHVNRPTGRTDQPANVKKSLANPEPSTHGTKRTSQDVGPFVRFRATADRHARVASTASVVNDPELT